LKLGHQNDLKGATSYKLKPSPFCLTPSDPAGLQSDFSLAWYLTTDQNNASPCSPDTGNLLSAHQNLDSEDQAPTPGLNAHIDELRVTAQFIDGLRTATLDNSNMREEDIQWLRDLPSDFPKEITDRHFLKVLRTFISTMNASEATYNGVCMACQTCYLDDPFLSFNQVKRKLEMLTRVVPIMHDMCTNMCTVFTGPFTLLDACPKCSRP
jgi:hypothetical protein